MKIGFPEDYPSPDALPFNHESLETDFQLSTPDQDPGGSGVWLLLQGQKLLTVSGENGPLLPTGDIPPVKQNEPPLYIGRWQGLPCRMIVLTDEDQAAASFELHSLQSRAPQLPLAMLSLAGLGLMIRHWEKSSRCCGSCGTELTRLSKEWGKECKTCGNHHFPRIHPCVIGLVVKDHEILLVRKPEWADGRFGLVAGFVEFGESLEGAMVREIAEEAGIQVDNLRYIGSQSWPFPSQLMTGFVADYVAGELKLQEDELAEADWYALDRLPILPPRRSIARYLIDQAEKYLRNR